MREDRDAIERLRDRLYSRRGKVGIKERTELRESRADITPAWVNKTPKPPSEEKRVSPPELEQRRSLLLTILFGSIIFFLGSIAVAFFIFLRGGNIVSSQNISLEIVGPSLVDGGKEATFQILIRNDNPTPLELADLIIEYPEGTRSATNVEEPLLRVRESLGTIAQGVSVKRTTSAILFGEEGGTQNIRATLEYRVKGSNAIFVKEGAIEVKLGSAPVSLLVEGPDEAVSGKKVEFTVTVSSNATAAVNNVLLRAEYPFGFSGPAASPETVVSDNLWQLGDLKPRERITVRVIGVLDGQDGEERVFRFAVGSEESETEVELRVPYLTVTHAVILSRPFVSGTLSLNGDGARTIAVPSGQSLAGTITWQNNLDTEVFDLEIEAVLQGQAFDRKTVSAPRGFYRSVDSTIVWDKENDATLGQVLPGGSGSAEFTFTPRNTAENGGILKNPEIIIEVNISAKRVSEGQVPQTVDSVITRRITVASPIVLEARGLHFSGPFVNGGPMPPTADLETLYTIIWVAKNPSSTVAGARVVASLPPSVRYTGQVTPTSERLSYNSANNTLSWDLGELKAGTGFENAARQVSFQIGFTPSVSQINSAPQITGRAVLTGDDRFAQTRVDTETPALTTRLPGDPQFVSGMEVVKAK